MEQSTGGRGTRTLERGWPEVQHVDGPGAGSEVRGRRGAGRRAGDATGLPARLPAGAGTEVAGLDAEQLARRSVPPSTMSLLGLIRHLADVERNWFRRVMAQADAPPLYWSDDVQDADWAGAVADPAVVADAWRLARGGRLRGAVRRRLTRPRRPRPYARRHDRRAARGDTPHGRGVPPPPRPRRSAPRADRRPRRPVTLNRAGALVAALSRLTYSASVSPPSQRG
jgi:hypothetical protein